MRKGTLAITAFALAVLMLAAGCSSMATQTAPQAAASSAPDYNSQYYPQATPAPTSEPGMWAEDESIAPAQRTYDISSEEYGEYEENVFRSPYDEPYSTFSIDVDTASYSNIRRYVEDGGLPPEDAVRVEECINYFAYDYTGPEGSDPVAVNVTISDCPWNQGRYLARVSVKARELELENVPKSNLVFLLDVSGSMDSPDKLPLVQAAMKMLADNIRDDDRVSIVVYAGASGVVLEGCTGEDRGEIKAAIGRLSAGGSTAGGEGIMLAYGLAEDYFIEGGNNRVILCTDGDFNVGLSTTEELEDLIEKKRDSGIYLSVLGFGTGNIKDNKMETLADKGNGNYAYIDSMSEAQKVLSEQLAATLFTVAKDVKIQVEFNPNAVKEYRLVGYDNRMLNPEDFNNDKKDAGEMGAGSCVTAFYELILVNSTDNSDNIDNLVFQTNDNSELKEPVSEWMNVKLRYKPLDSDESKLITVMAGKRNYTLTPDADYVFASAVAEFALLLKDSEYAGDASLDSVIARAGSAKGGDEGGYRSEFIQLAKLVNSLM